MVTIKIRHKHKIKIGFIKEKQNNQAEYILILQSPIDMFWHTGGFHIPTEKSAEPIWAEPFIEYLEILYTSLWECEPTLNYVGKWLKQKRSLFFAPLFKEWGFFNPIFLFWKYSGGFIYFKILHSCLNFRLEMLCGRNKPYLYPAFFNKFSMSCPLNKLNSSLECL